MIMMDFELETNMADFNAHDLSRGEVQKVAVATMLKGIDRYNPQNLETLEMYIETQARENTYDLEANLAILKLYQFNPQMYNEGIVQLILLKALTNLPHTDFVLCKCLLESQNLVAYEIQPINYLHGLLETCQFPLFWETVERLREQYRNPIPVEVEIVKDDGKTPKNTETVKDDGKTPKNTETVKDDGKTPTNTEALKDDGKTPKNTETVGDDGKISENTETGKTVVKKKEMRMPPRIPIDCIVGFNDSIQKFICHVVNITYQRIEKEELCKFLGYVSKDYLGIWMKKYNWKEVPDRTILISNQEENIKTKNITEKIEFESVAAIMSSSRF